MTTYLRSRKGDVNTREAWDEWMLEAYKYCGANGKLVKNGDHPPRVTLEIPTDYFARMSNILQLEEVDGREIDVNNLDDLKFYEGKSYNTFDYDHRLVSSTTYASEKGKYSHD